VCVGEKDEEGARTHIINHQTIITTCFTSTTTKATTEGEK
jgi:hypothetical protein